ncbi:hypothetical protein WJ968_11170 [Achromobacter xylosoxidans]
MAKLHTLFMLGNLWMLRKRPQMSNSIAAPGATSDGRGAAGYGISLIPGKFAKS